MTEFWEASFRDKKEMWGLEATESAKTTAKQFLKAGYSEVLIPGFGYGRNAKAFTELGMSVTGIEISQTAIDLAHQHFGNHLTIHHGSVTDMPFDNLTYDGIFCYALIHLLEQKEREHLIKTCYEQLNPGGTMVFVAISTNTPTFGAGTKLSHNRYETRHGVKLFYYDEDSILEEFGTFGIHHKEEITESRQVFWLISCVKK